MGTPTAIIDRSLGQLPKYQSGFLGNLSHDVASWLQLLHKADALSGPEREGIRERRLS